MTVSPHPRQVPGPGFLVAGRYRLKSKLGGGGMGAVWLANDQLLDREVAVKQVVSTEGMTAESAADIRSRALREGRMAARLSHRNAIAMHDLALESDEPWLVMEYLPSRSVAQILHTTGTLSVTHTAHIGAQVAAAMAAAHSEGIVHRDIKPGNILIANTGRDAGTVKISDFGISRAKDDTQAADAGVITGTPAYFAPEIARGGEPTEASDVYSLGATVYTAVEGAPPFGVDEDSLVLLHRVARGEINPPSRTGELTSAVLSMLEPSPARRPTMAQARDLLARVAAGPGGNVAAVLESPLPSNDHSIPVWGVSGRSSTRSNRSSPRTETGLPASRVRPPEPAPSVPTQPAPVYVPQQPPPQQSAPQTPTPQAPTPQTPSLQTSTTSPPEPSRPATPIRADWVPGIDAAKGSDSTAPSLVGVAAVVVLVLLMLVVVVII